MDSNTTNLNACSWGHDWQAVKSARTGLAVLVICRRCATAKWVGGDEAKS